MILDMLRVNPAVPDKSKSSVVPLEPQWRFLEIPEWDCMEVSS